MSTGRVIVAFLVVFSLVVLPGPVTKTGRVPGLELARAQPFDLCGGGGLPPPTFPCPWVAAGPAEDTLVTTIYTDEAAEFTDIQSASPHIDLTDYPLTPDLIGTFTKNPNFRITSTISESGYFEIQFMLANNFWGCDFNFGNSVCGVQIRQGIAHMIDTAKFATNEPVCSGQCIALDAPEPSNHIGGLPTANPCAWDASFPQTGSNCTVGAPGGIGYHLANATGANGVSWLQAPGSKDLDAAAAHFVAAGVATGCDGGTGIASCISSTDSKLSGVSAAAAAHTVNFFIRNDNPPRLHLGDAYASQICWIFTGSYTVPCLPYLVHVYTCCIGDFPGLTTSTTGVNLSWSIYTAAYSSPTGPLPFDSSLYFRYNSRFGSDIPSIQPPNGPCASTGVPTVSAPDYMYLCNTNYDSLTNQIESAPCITVPGDPVVGSTSNNSTATCAGTSQLSAIGAGVKAEDQFGKNAYTLPIFEQTAQFGYLNNGWDRVINNPGAGLPNYFTWLNAWNPSPVQPGTIRQGFRQTTNPSVSPFVDNSLWNQWIVGGIYDSLVVPSPDQPGQSVDWMALSVQHLANPSLTYTPPAGTTTSFRFTLRGDMFFQDGRKVTSFDVAFSYLALKATGSLAGAVAAPMIGATILSSTQFDLNLNTVSPFTLLTLPSLPVLPGAYWTRAGSSAWSTGVNTCTATGATRYPAQYTLSSPSGPVACTGTCATFPATLMNVNLAQTGPSYDPIANHTFVGSGPWQCGTVTSSGSGSCSTSGFQNPPVGGSYVLTRFGKGLAPGSSVSSIYFRSSGNLALSLWSQNNGDITHDFLNFSVVASCFGAPVTSSGPCAHFQQGIGANGGPISVGLSQVAIVGRFVGVNWVAPFNWASTPPVGILPLYPVLYENTITLNPASRVGCTTPYPTGGYDC